MKLLATCLMSLLCGNLALAQTSTDTLLIHFPYNESTITSLAVGRLDSMLKVGPLSTIGGIQLAGHCDFIGSDRYNDSLSLRRVQAVKAYLLAKGIGKGQLIEEAGLGKRNPLEPSSSDEARAINRRVQLIYSRQVIAVTPPLVVATPEIPRIERTTSTTGLSAMILDSSTKTGSTLILPDLNFEPGRHYLTSGSYGILRELYRAMLDHPSLEIEIQGHICCISGGQDGEDIDTRAPNLSVQRAKAIYEYLLSAGIDKKRMQYKGFGSSRKLFPDERTPMEQAKNRRVEIKILRK
ncbi:OmpA family protein [Paraflavitalea pollutisoli]|uniref:OmpA family protein n=1 Tax=Paraflavitalea pollutisoli TaxID=3034143 RepID=UPI0023EE0CDB|nr:OmpA family protein [Paraflavitalea sp. H1-2-19X]